MILILETCDTDTGWIWIFSHTKQMCETLISNCNLLIVLYYCQLIADAAPPLIAIPNLQVM